MILKGSRPIRTRTWLSSLVTGASWATYTGLVVFGFMRASMRSRLPCHKKFAPVLCVFADMTAGVRARRGAPCGCRLIQACALHRSTPCTRPVLAADDLAARRILKRRAPRREAHDQRRCPGRSRAVDGTA